MLISTDDGHFGFVIARLAGHGMFRFQMIIGGQVIGDQEPCMLGSAMHRLGNLASLNDARLGRLSESPAEVVRILRSEEEFHDAVTLSLAESLDQWLIQSYLYRGDATVLAQEYRNGELDGPVLVSVVSPQDYHSLVELVGHFWRTESDSPVVAESA